MRATCVCMKTILQQQILRRQELIPTTIHNAKLHSQGGMKKCSTRNSASTRSRTKNPAIRCTKSVQTAMNSYTMLLSGTLERVALMTDSSLKFKTVETNDASKLETRQTERFSLKKMQKQRVSGLEMKMTITIELYFRGTMNFPLKRRILRLLKSHLVCGKFKMQEAGTTWPSMLSTWVSNLTTKEVVPTAWQASKSNHESAKKARMSSPSKRTVKSAFVS
jgi:hypothetical protein